MTDDQLRYLTDTAWVIATIVLFSYDHPVGAVTCLLVCIIGNYKRDKKRKEMKKQEEENE